MAFHIVSNAALPLGLLAVGFALNLSAVKEASWPLISSSLIKLLLMPVVATLIGYLVGLSEMEIAVLLLFAAMPPATSSYILARQLGGHAPLMAAITTAQTLLAMVTLPIVLQLLPNSFAPLFN